MITGQMLKQIESNECNKRVLQVNMELLGTDRRVNQMNTMYQMLVNDRELTKRENAVKAFLEERKFPQREIDFTTDLNVVF